MACMVDYHDKLKLSLFYNSIAFLTRAIIEVIPQACVLHMHNKGFG